MITPTYRKTVSLSLIASLGGLLFGFDIAVFSGTIPFIQPELGLSPEQLGWVASCLYIGCIVGALIFGKISQAIGRKISLIIVAVIFLISSILMGLSDTVNTIVFWRIIAGFSVGGASVLSPLYIAEISPTAIRGKMVSINQLAVVIGILVAYLSNYFLSGTEWTWRWMFISGCLPALLFLVFIPFLPESPKWLLHKGKTEKGLKILKKIMPPEEWEEELNRIEAERNKKRPPFQWKQLFIAGNGTLLLIAIVIAVFQQISGANAVLFYAPIIFEKAGMNVNDQLFFQILIGAVNLIATFIAMSQVDKVGRKKLMLIGAGLMSILLFLISLSFTGGIFPEKVLSIFVLAFIATYAATLAPVTWVVISEIFPIAIREMSISIASAFLWLACFGLTYIFPVMIDQLSPFQTFSIFGGLCFIYFIFLLFFVPETKNNRV